MALFACPDASIEHAVCGQSQDKESATTKSINVAVRFTSLLPTHTHTQPDHTRHLQHGDYSCSSPREGERHRQGSEATPSEDHEAQVYESNSTEDKENCDTEDLDGRGQGLRMGSLLGAAEHAVPRRCSEG